MSVASFSSIVLKLNQIKFNLSFSGNFANASTFSFSKAKLWGTYYFNNFKNVAKSSVMIYKKNNRKIGLISSGIFLITNDYKIISFQKYVEKNIFGQVHWTQSAIIVRLRLLLSLLLWHVNKNIQDIKEHSKQFFYGFLKVSSTIRFVVPFFI